MTMTNGIADILAMENGKLYLTARILRSRKALGVDAAIALAKTYSDEAQDRMIADLVRSMEDRDDSDFTSSPAYALYQDMYGYGTNLTPLTLTEDGDDIEEVLSIAKRERAHDASRKLINLAAQAMQRKVDGTTAISLMEEGYTAEVAEEIAALLKEDDRNTEDATANGYTVVASQLYIKAKGDEDYYENSFDEGYEFDMEAEGPFVESVDPDKLLASGWAHMEEHWNFYVGNCAHWQPQASAVADARNCRKVKVVETWRPEQFEKHVASTSMARRYYGIEDVCFDKRGRERVNPVKVDRYPRKVSKRVKRA